MMVFLLILCVLLAAGLVVALVQNRRLRRTIEPTPDVVEVPLSASQDPDFALFQRLDSLMDQEKLFLDPALDRERLCELLGIEKNRMGRLIQLYSGCQNLPGYVNRKRVQYACRLMLQHPEWTLQAVAESSGIPSTATFNRVFRSVQGMSPTAWLRLQIPRQN